MPRGGYRENSGRKPKSESQAAKIANVDLAKIDLDEVLPQRTGEAESVLFFRKILNDDSMPIRMRMEAAKQLLPYQAKRAGETGKKDDREKKAKETAKKFAKNEPPRLVKNG